MHMKTKHVVALLAWLGLATVGVLAANERVTGVVLKLSIESNSVTVKTGENSFRTLSLTDKTVYRRGPKVVDVQDLMAGDRVTIEVREKTAQAMTIQIAPPAPQKGRDQPR
jgi:hypothetical protein